MSGRISYSLEACEALYALRCSENVMEMLLQHLHDKAMEEFRFQETLAQAGVPERIERLGVNLDLLSRRMP